MHKRKPSKNINCVVKIYFITKIIIFMKKLELNQMELLNGGKADNTACIITGVLAVLISPSAGPFAPLAVAAGAMQILSC